MARKDSEGNILRLGESQLKNGTYQYRWIDEKGMIRITRADDLETLRGKILQIHQYLDYGIPTDVMSMTMDQLYQLWLSEKTIRLRTRTLQRYTGMYEQVISPSIGVLPITDLHRMEIRQFCENLGRDRNLQESTVRNYYRLIYQILEYGVRERYLLQNPAKRAYRSGSREKTGTSRPLRKTLTLAEQRILMEVMEEIPKYRRWQPVIRFMLFTGLRIGEIEALRWEDVDLNRKVVYVRHTMGRKKNKVPEDPFVSLSKENGESETRASRSEAAAEANAAENRDDGGSEKDTVCRETTAEIPTSQRKDDGSARKKKKNSRNSYRKCLTRPKTITSERRIPLLKQSLSALEQERKEQAARGITCKEKVDGYEDYVFLKDNGRLLSDTFLNKILRDLFFEGKKRNPEIFSGMEKITCHVLRHTFATRMYEAGVQLKVIQDVMGHADISMTMNVYTETEFEKMKKELQRLK